MSADYYRGAPKGKTYLDLYSLSEGQKIVFQCLEDQDAYDNWHVPFYLKEKR